MTHGGQDGHLLGPDTAALLKDTWPALLLPPSIDVVRRPLPSELDRVVADALRLLHHDHAIGPLWHGGTGHDLGALVGSDRLRGRGPGPDGLDDRELIRQIGPAAGIAIDHRLVEGRHVHVGCHILGQDAAHRATQVTCSEPSGRAAPRTMRKASFSSIIALYGPQGRAASRVWGSVPKCAL